MLRICILIASITLSLQIFSMSDARMLRHPDINNQLIAFVYAGDIWTVHADGGTAKRLTSHPGIELFPKISPDGQWIAFSAEYSGSRQVWVMPARGGTARQLTFYNSVGEMPPRGGFDHVVLDWTPDSKKVLFRANRTPFGDRNGRYFTVSIDGGFEEPLPIVNGGFASFSPDGKELCFTPVDREFRSWKRYKGGRATELWTYNLRENSSRQITRWAGSDQWPVWHGNSIFYASDRDTRLNIWRHDLATGQETQLTHHSEFDAMWPSGSNGKLAYELGGFLRVLDLATGDDRKITVSIQYDNPNLHASFKSVKGNIGSYALSPTGKRVLFEARGDIFSLPVEKGEIQNLTNTQGVREMAPAWSPDGKQIAYYSDATGEYELYLLENKKEAAPRQITRGSSAWKHAPEWSPRSTHLVYSDRSMKLWLVDISTGKQTAIDEATAEEITDYSWSPDGDWIAYSKSSPNYQAAIWAYRLSTGRKHQLTGDTYSDNTPLFSRDGKFLFFLSNRDFNLAFSSFEFDYLYNNATRVYALPLRNDGTALAPYKEDKEPYGKGKDAADEKRASKEERATTKEQAITKERATEQGAGTSKEKSKEREEGNEVKVLVDLENIHNRVQVLPMSAGTYRLIGTVKEGLLYASGNKVMRYHINEEKSQEILDGAGNGLLAADGKSFIYRSGGTYGVAKNQPGQKAGGKTVDLSNLSMKIDPRAEWKQIYADAFRIFRDYFYVDNLHEVDWKGIEARYGALLPHVPSRFDLDYILNEIVSETNTGHAYVDWGDIGRVERVNGGLLGAELEADPEAGRYKIRKIYQGENWNPARRSPLTEIGVDVNEGDYLLRINGEELTTEQNPYELLENLGDRHIALTVSASSSGSAPRTSHVRTITSEHELRYVDWVDERRAMVHRLSGGTIGYIHVPNTAVDGNRELFKGLLAYHHMDALIIDDRYNGGGFIPDRMIDLLNRRTLVYWHRNGLTLPMKSPAIAHDGPKAMLINGYSSSGGDAFPHFFRETGEGKLIGTRTWGGLVGISGNARLVDGGYISVPRFGIYDPSGEWIIEGVGVYPDIEVVDRPEELAKGNDPSLEKAVEVLLEELKNNPPKRVEAPAPPDRSRWIEFEIE